MAAHLATRNRAPTLVICADPRRLRAPHRRSGAVARAARQSRARHSPRELLRSARSPASRVESGRAGRHARCRLTRIRASGRLCDATAERRSVLAVSRRRRRRFRLSRYLADVSDLPGRRLHRLQALNWSAGVDDLPACRARHASRLDGWTSAATLPRGAMPASRRPTAQNTCRSMLAAQSERPM